MSESLFLSNRELDKLSLSDRLKYFERLRNYCKTVKSVKNKGFFGRTFVSSVYHHFREYDYDYYGLENIPKDRPVIFVCNHSNSHDILGAIEITKELGIEASILVASDDLTKPTLMLFDACDAVLFDRRKRSEGERAIIDLSSRILNGRYVFIFGEATWNMHPFRPMQDIKIGAANTGAITNAPALPVIFEYVEVPELCRHESDLYKKCRVTFEKPIKILPEVGLVEQTSTIKRVMEDSRRDGWRAEGIYRDSLDNIDIERYLNHTYLKKFDGFGFTYDSEEEANYLFGKPDNEYHLDENGLFVPGVTTKEDGKRFVLKK